jgi:hypothetical protein
MLDCSQLTTLDRPPPEFTHVVRTTHHVLRISQDRLRGIHTPSLPRTRKPDARRDTKPKPGRTKHSYSDLHRTAQCTHKGRLLLNRPTHG